ncbi:hybrid sensor histidine kinase/response regulator [Pseudomonas atacamensis]|uniref:histidine kinase n=2 Tax=Pseudomonas atacamensis TaxID=2565368 RepID=A0ABQ5PCZ3_9PSED|nr:hybrid sensor histidine kinase/response regulator [Pseudomonas atacamensis]GLH52126.1 hybrid sensor histidine kinase/response regulator [Pseudomonas atacamensis]
MGFEQNQFEGVAADYLGVIQATTGIRLKVLRFSTRAEARKALLEGHVDMLALHDVSEGQEGAITQSRPYLLNNKVIARRIGETRQTSPDLAGERLAYVGDDAVGALLKQQYPKAILIRYSNHLIGLTSLIYDQADAFWTDAIVAEYLIRMLYNNDIYIVGDAMTTSADINFAVSDRKPQLLVAINDTLDALPQNDMKRITSRWGLGDHFVADRAPLKLNPEELAWIERHKKIKILLSSSYAPLSFYDQNNKLQGLTADLLAIIAQRTGLKTEIVRSDSVLDMLRQLEDNQADLIAALSIGDLRLNPEQYTRPYTVSPFVVITQHKYQIDDLNELSGKRLAIPAGNPLSKWLERKHPEIIQVPVATAARGIELVSNGDVAASVHTQIGANYFIKHHFRNDLKISGVVGPNPARIGMVVAKEDMPLKSIINKVMLEIPPEEFKTLSDRWRNHAAPAVASSWSTYKSSIYKVIGVALLFLLAFLVWNYYLQAQIKKRKRAEIALSDQLSFSKTLIDGSPIALYVRDKAGQLVHCNRTYLEFLQTTPEVVLGRTLPDAEVLPTSVSQQYHQIYQSSEQHPEPVFRDLEIEVKGQPHRIYHWTLPFQSSTGEFSGVIGGWLDISEREQLVEQLRVAKQAADEANESKSIFLASMSHEIRTPISALIGLIEMLRVRGGTPQQINDNLAVAHESAQSLLSLIGDILDLSKIEAGAMVASPRPTRLSELLHSVHKLFNINATNKNLTFDLVIDVQDQHVIIDSLMLNQIIANLISNAIKFTDQGFVQLSLKQLPDDPKSNLARYDIEVRDSGIGLDEQQRKAIFEPFVQVGSAPTSVRGTGLGLSICTRLASLLNAQLSVDSRPDKGSCFRLHFEAERTAGDDAQESTHPIAPTSLRLNILVAEDHAANRLLLCQQLEYLGHRAVPCDDGETAFAQWEAADPPFDLTITDCNMPRMDGYELTRRIRTVEQSRGLGMHPIFGLTANAQSQIIQDSLDAGMTQCLFKPMSIETLTEQIRAVSIQIERQVNAARTTGGELEKLRILCPDAYGPLVDELINTNRQDAARLEQLMLNKELNKIGSLAHKIKGGAQLADAQDLVEACVQLELLVNMADADACYEQIKSLIHCMQKLEQRLHAAI